MVLGGFFYVIKFYRILIHCENRKPKFGGLDKFFAAVGRIVLSAHVTLECFIFSLNFE